MADKTVGHTPGPWHVTDNPHPTARGFVYGPDGLMVGDARSLRRAVGELDANARLIAAAPDMLEALRALLASAVYDEERSDECIEAGAAARAAIAKAEGRAS